MSKLIHEINSISSETLNGNRVHAKKTSNRSIDLIIESNIIEEATNKELYEGLPASMFALLYKSEPKVGELINEGVEFNVSFTTKDGVLLSECIANKKSIEKLITENIENKHQEKFEENSATDSQENEALSILNKNLPIEIKESGITISKIYINGKRQFVINIIFTNDELSKKIHSMKGNKEMENLFKKDLLRQPQTKQMQSAMESMNINEVLYHYTDKSGKTLMDIVLSPSDIL